LENRCNFLRLSEKALLLPGKVPDPQLRQESMQNCGVYSFYQLSFGSVNGCKAMQKLNGVYWLLTLKMGSASEIEVAQIKSHAWAVPETVGLSLAEGK
jgi:hypothetical protein